MREYALFFFRFISETVMIMGTDSQGEEVDIYASNSKEYSLDQDNFNLANLIDKISITLNKI